MDYSLKVAVHVEDVADLLSFETLPDNCRYGWGDSVLVEAEVEQAEIERLGFTADDDIDPGIEMSDLEPFARDLSEAIDLLLAGDRKMGLTLLSRALSEWPDAQRIVEMKFSSSPPRDPRQPPLMLGA